MAAKKAQIVIASSQLQNIFYFLYSGNASVVITVTLLWI